MDQELSEHVVLELLWDLADPASLPRDPMACAPADLFDVITEYLPSPTLVDRGHAGVDLVDLLDGFVCRGHDDTGLGTLLADAGFPYDFGGPAPPCPKPAAPFDLTLSVSDEGGRLRVTLGMTSRRRLAMPAALLRVPRRGGEPVLDRRELAPIEPGRPVLVEWILPPGLDPPWVAAGLDAAQGPMDTLHGSVMVERRRPQPDRIERIDLGGLVRLRVARP